MPANHGDTNTSADRDHAGPSADEKSCANCWHRPIPRCRRQLAPASSQAADQERGREPVISAIAIALRLRYVHFAYSPSAPPRRADDPGGEVSVQDRTVQTTSADESAVASESRVKGAGARAPRLRIDLQLRYRPVGGRRWHEGQVENISRSGVLFRGTALVDV